MILGPISLIDCLVFVVCLIPRLLLDIGVLGSLRVVFQVLPFLVFKLPYTTFVERVLVDSRDRSPFTRNATLFQDIVIRCVRYAFAYIPARVGRVFFSKWVAYPFFRFRLLRHGYLKLPFHCHELDRFGVKGLWISPDPARKPDVVVYYCHGGGFSMGSAYFYLEFLVAWMTQLKVKGYQNPAILALEYTLVPDGQWPKQFEETRAGYKFLYEYMKIDPSTICVSGDSAGATLILSLLLHKDEGEQLPRPGSAVLVSPWTHLVSDLNQNTASDYLDSNSLHLYARQYTGLEPVNGNIISPGLNSHWKEAAPANGFYILHGSEEVFTPGIQVTVKNMKRDGAQVRVYQEEAAVHAWPVVNLFLCDRRAERLKGIDLMTDILASTMEQKSTPAPSQL